MTNENAANNVKVDVYPNYVVISRCHLVIPEESGDSNEEQDLEDLNDEADDNIKDNNDMNSLKQASASPTKHRFTSHYP